MLECRIIKYITYCAWKIPESYFYQFCCSLFFLPTCVRSIVLTSSSFFVHMGAHDRDRLLQFTFWTKLKGHRIPSIIRRISKKPCIHGNASFLLLNFSSSFTRNNSLYLCRPLSRCSYPLFIPSPLYLVHLSFRILIIPVAFFLTHKRWKNMFWRENNSFL